MSGIDDFVRDVEYSKEELDKYLLLVDEWKNGYKIYRHKENDRLFCFKELDEGYEFISAWDEF